MKAQNIAIIVLISLLPNLVSLAPDYDDTNGGHEVEADISDDSNDSEIEFINKSKIGEKLNKNLTEANEETTTVGIEDEETEEIEPDGFVDTILNRGPNLMELPKNSSNEQVYIYLSNLLSDVLEKKVNELMPQIHEYFFTLNELVSQNCFQSIMRLSNSVRKGEPRAIKILDASAKFLITNGLMSGTFTDLGNFDQCINAVDSANSEKPLNGKYCLLKIKFPLPEPKAHLKYSDRILDFKNTSLENTSIDYILNQAHRLYYNPFLYGLCFPSECDANDIQMLYNNTFGKFHFEAEVGNDCYTQIDHKFNVKALIEKLDLYSVVSILGIGLMCALVGLATIYELVYNWLLNSKPTVADRPLAISFSLISNVRKLYSLEINESEQNLQSINGIKVMAIIWTVIANVYLVGYQPQIKSFIKNIQTEMSGRGGCLGFQFILNAWNASQIFFLIGGIFMAYTTTVRLNKTNGRIDLVKYVLKRWLRLTPPIMFPILLVFLLPLFSNGGPIYKSSTSTLFDNCAQNWWKSLLFINNWLDPNHSCLPHLWFISAYFQLNIIGIIVLSITYKRPKTFNLLIITLISIGILFPMTMTYIENLSAKSPFMSRPLLGEIGRDLKLKHFLTFNHFCSYFIGIAIGLNLTSFHTKFNITILMRLILWTVLPIISLISVLITFLWNDMRSEPTIIESIAYNGLNRILFISSIAWITSECVAQRAGLINKLLSNKLLMPLSRLTYQIYLLNLIIIWLYYFTKRDLIVYRDFELLFITSGVLVLTVITSIFGYLVFEAPFVHISQHIFKTTQKSESLETKPKLKLKPKPKPKPESIASTIQINVESFEINGNTINGKKYVTDCEDSIDIRL